jgi:glycerophosphoryl diester phosphodiesterase
MTKNYAHRGFCALYPENTMLAFQKAVEAGCDGIELDVHLTADNRIVIIHDEDVGRTTNGKGFVKDLPFDRIKELDAGQGQTIPSLDEYFDFVQNLDITTNIELKNLIFPYQGLEERVIRLIRERRLEDRVIFSSFNHQSVYLCKSTAPEIKCGLLYDCKLINCGAYARDYGIEYLHPNFPNLTAESIREIHQAKVMVNVWGVNSRTEMEHTVSMEADGIITNDPALLHLVLQQKGGIQGIL